MTNEEFTSITSVETPFIEALNKVFVKFYVGKKEQEYTIFRKTPLGDYVWKAHHIVSEIKQNLEDIRFAERMLNEQSPDALILKKGEDAAHVIRYHYENYILRMTKIRDLSLALINHIMMFKIKKGLNMETRVLKLLDPKYGKFEIIWRYMKELTDYIKPYRNHLAHNGTIQHEDLALLSAHYNFELDLKDIREQFRYEMAMNHVQEELIEKFTAQIKAYLHNSEEVLKLIYVYLTKPFLDCLELLVKAHNA